MEDLSWHIAGIQVALRNLGMSFEHPRIQSWLERAADKYLSDCQTRGELPLMPPPWRGMGDLPPDVVRGLFAVLEKQNAISRNTART